MPAAAASPAVDAGEAWFDAPFEEDPHAAAIAVNEGELVILERPPDTPVHQHSNRLVISASSLADGWLDLYQCHSNLDRVHALQIVYNDHKTADLAVASQKNVGKAEVQGHTVQIEDIAADSEVCIAARTRALQKNGEQYVLKNGPFMRRFLDGYYPMRVRLEVYYPSALIRFESASPVAAGRKDAEAGYAEVDVWFEGRLKTELRFSAVQ